MRSTERACLALHLVWLARTVQVRCQGLHGLKVRQKHLTTQRVEEMATLQAIHDRTFYFAQMQRYAGTEQAIVDGFKTLQRARINIIDGRAQRDKA